MRRARPLPCQEIAAAQQEDATMHQQIRLRLAKSSTQDTPGAMPADPIETGSIEVRRGALLRLLDTLAEAGYNLQSAGGASIEGPGEFVFSLDDEDHQATVACAQFLRDKGYRGVRVQEVAICRISHRPGELARCLRDVQQEGLSVHEVFVGAPDADGNVLAYITTLRTRDIEEGEAESKTA